MRSIVCAPGALQSVLPHPTGIAKIFQAIYVVGTPEGCYRDPTYDTRLKQAHLEGVISRMYLLQLCAKQNVNGYHLRHMSYLHQLAGIDAGIVQYVRESCQCRKAAPLAGGRCRSGDLALRCELRQSECGEGDSASSASP